MAWEDMSDEGQYALQMQHDTAVEQCAVIVEGMIGQSDPELCADLTAAMRALKGAQPAEIPPPPSHEG